MRKRTIRQYLENLKNLCWEIIQTDPKKEERLSKSQIDIIFEGVQKIVNREIESKDKEIEMLKDQVKLLKK